MTTEDFLQAFRRMANRRGMARVIHSDNQTTFHKAAKVFKASTQRMQLMDAVYACGFNQSETGKYFE